MALISMGNLVSKGLSLQTAPFSHSIVIARPALDCWNVLLEFENYRTWNDSKYFRSLKVVSTPREDLVRLVEHVNLFKGFDLTLRFPMEVYLDQGKFKMVFRWLFPRLVLDTFDIHHQFLIDPLDDDRCRFTHRFEIKGLIGRASQMMTPGIYADACEHYDAFNRSLRSFVEGGMDKISSFDVSA